MPYIVDANTALNGTTNGAWKRVGQWKTAAATRRATRLILGNGFAARVRHTYANGVTVAMHVMPDGTACEVKHYPPGSVELSTGPFVSLVSTGK